MFQQITLVGNLGNDPEMRYTPSGVPVATFSLAVGRVWNDPEGQRQEKTTWFRVTAWRRDAELVSQYLSKGRQVLIIGEVEEARAFTDRDGNNRASLEVTARTIRFIGSRGDNSSTSNNDFASEPVGASGGGGSNRGSNSGGNRNNASKNNAPANDMDMTDEDIPF